MPFGSSASACSALPVTQVRRVSQHESAIKRLLAPKHVQGVFAEDLAADVQGFPAVARMVEASAGDHMGGRGHETGRNENVGVDEHAGSAIVAGYILESPRQTSHIVVDLLAAHREVLRPGPRIVWGQNLPDGEPPPPNGRCGRLRQHHPVHEHRRLPYDTRLLSAPSRGLPGEGVVVVDACLQTRPQGSAQACRIGQAVAENRFRLAEDRPPFRLRVNGKKMSVKRRIHVPGRDLVHEPVSDGSHKPYLGKSFTHSRQYEHAPIDRQRGVAGW